MTMKIHLDTVIPLLHRATYGVLATQSTQVEGYPFASILPFALDERHYPVFLVSGLAEHTKNLMADHRASFLVSSPDGHNVLTVARLTIVGDVERFDASQELVARYLRYQPDAKQYLDLGDFAFFRLTPKRARYVAGFGEMGWMEEVEWANGAVMPLIDEAKFYRELIEVLPMGIRLLGLDYYGVDIERQGKRERQQFPNAPVGTEHIGEVTKRFLAAL
ncbi:HugZ family protein [Undibacterium arcticum]|uniref:HugZ family protein n=1 Tax=Undibacterium arcticum TaxID=1762892 RepID=A0ABV7F8S6_9BURK